jgi:hypothetical protein
MSQIPLDDPNAPALAPSTTTAVLERTQTVPVPEVQEPGDHERFAHYADKNKIMESALSGAPVVALCGKVWVPGRDPKKFPVCPTCREILDELFPPQGGDKRGKGGDKGGTD